jgi:hypothetical protein
MAACGRAIPGIGRTCCGDGLVYVVVSHDQPHSFLAVGLAAKLLVGAVQDAVARSAVTERPAVGPVTPETQAE